MHIGLTKASGSKHAELGGVWDAGGASVWPSLEDSLRHEAWLVPAASKPAGTVPALWARTGTVLSLPLLCKVHPEGAGTAVGTTEQKGKKLPCLLVTEVVGDSILP